MKTRTMTRTQAELLLAAVIIARSTSYVLTKVGLQDMGKFTLLAVRFLLAFAFLAALFRRRLLQIDRRKEGKQERMTCYLHQGTALTQAGTDCILDAGAALPGAVLDFLGLPKESEDLEETAVESRLIAEQDVAGIVEAGCGETLARLITAAAAGEGGYAQLVRITDKVQTQLLALAWSEAGTVTVEVEYPDDREVFRLTPVSAQAAGERIAAMAAL